MLSLLQQREILESIESLSALQRARVLEYIMRIRTPGRDEDAREKLKSQALIQIRQALRASHME